MATPNFGLANQVNQFMGQQVRAPYLANLPNYASMVGQRSQNTTNMLRGEVPPDVLRQIQQRGAERGVATGMTGGSNTNASWLQALGLTSLGLQQQGSKELSQSIADTPVPEPWNPLSLYLAQLEQEQAASAVNPTPWRSPAMSPWRSSTRMTDASGGLL
jgi:hypothetical protein